MARLDEAMKEFIVKRLACFYTPTQVAEAVRVRFGVKVTRQQVHGYDPESSQPPGQRWVALHAETRVRFLCEGDHTAAAGPASLLELLGRPGPRPSADVLQERAARFPEQIDRERRSLYEEVW
jgi:hypothetical protein